MAGYELSCTLGPLDELITKGLNALRECLPGDAELTNQVIDYYAVLITYSVAYKFQFMTKTRIFTWVNTVYVEIFAVRNFYCFHR